jgi:hypothetical protein
MSQYLIANFPPPPGLCKDCSCILVTSQWASTNAPKVTAVDDCCCDYRAWGNVKLGASRSPSKTVQVLPSLRHDRGPNKGI